MQSYKKGEQTVLSKHFFSTDFDCHCHYEDCTETFINPKLVEGLQEFYEDTGGFLITSGFRCAKHNAEVQGAPKSQHLLGNAADCRSVKNYNGRLMARMAEDVKIFRMGGIGIYPTFCHVDVGPKRRWAIEK